MPALVFIVIMAIIYFIVQVAFPSVHVSLLQAAAITFLVIMVRVMLFEGITVKIHGADEVYFEREDDDDDRYKQNSSGLY
jgi:hypothetical protein